MALTKLMSCQQPRKTRKARKVFIVFFGDFRVFRGYIQRAWIGAGQLGA